MACILDTAVDTPISRQQKAERYYFRRFQSAYHLPSTNIIFGDKPDVIIRAEQRIGVEITKIGPSALNR